MLMQATVMARELYVTLKSTGHDGVMLVVGAG